MKENYERQRDEFTKMKIVYRDAKKGHEQETKSNDANKRKMREMKVN